MIIHLIEKTQKNFTEMIPKFDVSRFINDQKEIVLTEMLSALKELGFPIEGNMIYYYSPDAEMFVYCGTDVIQEEVTIPKEDYFEHGKVSI